MDLFGIGSMIGAVGDTVIGGINAHQQKEAFEWNKQQAEKVFNWNKEVQQRTWEREDTAVQRRLNDLKASGINPLMAAGQSANSGGQVAQTAPNLEAPSINIGLSESISKVIEAISASQNIAQSKAQEQLIQSEILTGEKTRGKITKETQKMQKEIDKMHNETLKIDAERNKITSEMMKIDSERQLHELQRQINLYNYLRSKGMKLRTTDNLPNSPAQVGFYAGQAIGNNAGY